MARKHLCIISLSLPIEVDIRLIKQIDKVLLRPWYDRPRIERMWDLHVRELRNYNQVIYSMVTAEQWLSHVENSTVAPIQQKS